MTQNTRHCVIDVLGCLKVYSFFYFIKARVGVFSLFYFGRNKPIFKKDISNRSALSFYLLLCFFLVLLDQYIKLVVIHNLKLLANVTIIPGILNAMYVRNFGAAFSIFFKKTTFLIIFAVIIMIFLIIYILKVKMYDRVYIFCVVTVVAGGIGNLLDRIFRGYVVDYINLTFWPFNNFAIFNLADFLIVFGSLVFMLKFLKGEYFK